MARRTTTHRHGRSKLGTREELNQLISDAWDWLWADNLKERKRGPDSFRYSETFYLTAADVESQVRSFIQEDLEGAERGSRGRGCYGHTDVRISGLGRGGLQGAVRNWLLHNDKLTGHNFGRGHISGMRFRPVGEELSPAEKKTVAKKQKREKQRAEGTILRHISDDGKALCTRKARKNSKRRGFSRGRHRSNTSFAYKPEDVTCEKCKKALEELHELVRAVFNRELKAQSGWLLDTDPDGEGIKHVRIVKKGTTSYAILRDDTVVLVRKAKKAEVPEENMHYFKNEYSNHAGLYVARS